jgi:hypothetical protein
MNERGIVLEGETDEGREGKTIKIRVGQCWKRGKEIIEILGLGDETAEVMIWEGKRIEVGRRVKVNKRNKYEGYPMGMGSRKVMRREEIGEEGVLVELSKDRVKGREMTCNLAAMRTRVLELGKKIIKRGQEESEEEGSTTDESSSSSSEEGSLLEEEKGWEKWKGKSIKRIYTDGSYKEDKTMRSMMLGGHKVTAGGGIVIQGDDGLYTPLRILMDVEVESAFPVETITLIASCLIGEGKGSIEIGTDCKGAQAAVKGRNKDFKRLGCGTIWVPDKDLTIKKVKAHPERREGVWDNDDVGIYLADEVASGRGGKMEEIRATKVLKHLGSLGCIAIVDNNNIPFFGNIMKRNSKMRIKKYFEKRDEYRDGQGKIGIWNGSSLNMMYKMLGRSGTMEDNSAANRIGWGKRWKMSRYNSEICHACGKDGRSNNHALRGCRNEEVEKRRKVWYDDVNKNIYKIMDRDIRGLLEDMWTKMKCRRGGEMAMCGCFQPRWVELLLKGMMPLRDGEDKIIMKILKIIGAGAREIIKIYCEEIKQGELSRNIRQTNILGYFGRRGKGIDTNRNLIKYKGEIVREGKKKSKKHTINKIIRKGGIETVNTDNGLVKWKFKER